MSLRREVLHSLKWLAGARLAGQAIAWTITLVVIRILKPSDYGLMAIAEVLIGFATLFQELGLFSAMVQKRDLNDRHVEQAFGLLILINSGIYLLVFAMAPLLAGFFGDQRLVDIVRVLGIQFPLASFGVVQDAMLSRSMRFKQKSLANLVIGLGNGLTTLGFALAGFGVWALVFGSLAGALVRPFALGVAARHWCRPRFSRDGMSEMLRFGSFVTISKVLWYAYSRSDVFIIGKILGKELLGFYSIAMHLASLPMQKVSEMLDQVGFAAYASVQHDMEAIRGHFLRVIRVLGFISFPVFWGISSVAPDLVAVVLGQRWERAVIPLQLLGLVGPIRMIGHGSGSVLTAIGKPHIGTLSLLLAILIMPPAFFIGTYYGGLLGASLAWVIGYPVLVLARLPLLLPPLGLASRQYFAAMLGPATGGAVMYLAVMLARDQIAGTVQDPIVGMILLVLVGTVIYPAFMWIFWRGVCREVLDLLRKR
ncbi:oligosaccharide flippase family protein [Oleiagrimonas sp. C23AA]|uniref:oligosaccharide flippase family protein n=1 Tax=Oleiagrimonas sp. C23AA TaxID=2719047 RepID=UPI00141E1716|nr:oligosaccharide flippase family protein [Oleiagrimonas sp. C23AA]NII11155.1 oligosaccharide flippase family protein [Oleiagrimonas sp. C23AA]